jgi:hypothetical protein
MERSPARVEFGAESFLHVDGTLRAALAWPADAKKARPVKTRP